MTNRFGVGGIRVFGSDSIVIPCGTVITTSYPLSATTDSGYCYDGTYWYGVAHVGSNFNIVRYNYPAFTGATTVVSGGFAFYPALDFAGNLYYIDYGSNTIKKKALPSGTPSTLASITGNAWGLVYHETTGLLYYLDFHTVAGVEHDYLYSVDPTSGSVTQLLDLTIGSSSPGFRSSELITSSPNYLWGRGYISSPTNGLNLWHYNVNTNTFVEGYHTGTGVGGIQTSGIGLTDDTVLTSLNTSGTQPWIIDTAFTAVASPCGQSAGTTAGGVSHSGWHNIAWALNNTIIEIVVP